MIQKDEGEVCSFSVSHSSPALEYYLGTYKPYKRFMAYRLEMLSTHWERRPGPIADEEKYQVNPSQD